MHFVVISFKIISTNLKYFQYNYATVVILLAFNMVTLYFKVP